MQPHEPFINADCEEVETRCLAQLVDQSADYTVIRPSLIVALGVSDEDLRQWESRSTIPPRIETVAMPEDEGGDFEVSPRGGGDTEFSLDDPDEEDADDDDAEKPQGEDSEGNPDEEADGDAGVGLDDDVIVDDDDGAAD
jgi:hypothetical protein